MALWMWRHIRIHDALRQRHPESPWLWKADWEKGLGEPVDGPLFWVPLIGVVMTIGFAIPGMVVFSQGSRSSETDQLIIDVSMWIAAVFSLVWTVTYYLRSHGRYGTACELVTMPGVPGNVLICRFRNSNFDLSSGDAICHLICEACSSRTKSTNTRVKFMPIWSGESVNVHFERADALGVGYLCAEFNVPEGLPVFSAYFVDGVRWRVSLQKKRDKPRVIESFLVPVFRT